MVGSRLYLEKMWWPQFHFSNLQYVMAAGFYLGYVGWQQVST
jgi:hypothetical protein